MDDQSEEAQLEETPNQLGWEVLLAEADSPVDHEGQGAVDEAEQEVQRQQQVYVHIQFHFIIKF